MMKNLLVLALVLGMATMASAALRISYDGAAVANGGSTMLSIYSDTDVAGDLEYYALVANTAGAVISGGTVNGALATYSGLSVYDNAVVDGGMPVPDGTDGVWGGVTVFAGEAAILANTPLIQNIKFDMLSDQDVVVQLWFVRGTDWSLGQMLDSVTVAAPVIPEPMTMALLGLGGLFLRRRK